MCEKLLLPALDLYTCDQACDQTVIKTQIEELIAVGIFNK